MFFFSAQMKIFKKKVSQAISRIVFAARFVERAHAPTRKCIVHARFASARHGIGCITRSLTQRAVTDVELYMCARRQRRFSCR